MLDGALLDMIWCGSSLENDNDVLVLTEKGTVYRSVDRGYNFERKT